MIDWVTDIIAISEYPSSKTDLSGFGAILNLDKFTPYHTTIHHAHYPILDGPGNEVMDIAAVVHLMHDLIARGKVLVHCAAGVSRSPWIIALYLAWKEPLTFTEALDIVARGRSRPLNIDPGLLALTDDVLAHLKGSKVGA